MKMEQTECSKTSAYKIRTPGNYPEESVQEDSCLLQGLRYTKTGSRVLKVITPAAHSV